MEECSGVLRVGDRAPDFSSTSSSGTPWALSGFAGKTNVVLFFYPKDNSSGCTRQVCSYRDNLEAIMELNAVMLGVSRDSDASHERFIAENRLPFPLMSDRDGRLSALYGVERLWGIIPFVKRVTYVIDRQGIVRGVIHDEFRIERHTQEVLRILRAIR